MAKCDVKVEVSLEKVISKAMADALQSIADQRGILVHQVSVEWADISTTAENKSQVTDVSLSISTRV